MALNLPFVQAYLVCFPSMKLGTLANFSLAVTNGSHAPAGTIGKTTKTKLRIPKPAGIAVTSPEILKLSVTKLCGTRRVQPGKVTTLLREKYALDSLRAGERMVGYIDGDDAEPTRSDCVDRYSFNALEKHHAYLLKKRPPHTLGS
jgi:hypothetical protein